MRVIGAILFTKFFSNVFSVAISQQEDAVSPTSEGRYFPLEPSNPWGFQGRFYYAAIEENVDKWLTEFEAKIEENLKGLRNNTESDLNQIRGDLDMKKSDLKRIEGDLMKRKSFVDSSMAKLKSDIGNKTEERQRIKDELDEMRTSHVSKMEKMESFISDRTRDMEENMRKDSMMWKDSTESEMNQLKADLERKDDEIRSLRKILLPENCKDTRTTFLDGNGGVVRLHRNNALYEVYCDMVNDGGNWIVFQRRLDGSVDFFRTWEDYAIGFGNKNGEFWLGLETVYQLTQNGNYELRVDLTDWDGSTAYAKYGTFSISGRSDGYRLTVGEYSGTAGNGLGYNNGRQFTTKDKDYDGCRCNCGTLYRGAWWFVDCGYSNLNGQYNDTSDAHCGVNWYHWKNRAYYSLKMSEMKFRKK